MGNRIVPCQAGRKKKTGMAFDSLTAASLGVAEFFINCKRDEISKKNGEGWTPLMYACSFGHFSTMEVLLRRGATTDSRNNAGRTAIMLAAANGHADMLHVLLLLSSAEVLGAVDDRGWSAVFHAAHSGQLECMKILIQHKCNINSKASPSGKTVLMVAVRGGNLDLVKALLCCGADATVVAKGGTTALGIAEAQGFTRIADVLWTHIVGPRWGHLKLLEFLNFLNLNKYHILFVSKNIDFQKFLTMTDEDLKSTGITLLGPRKKMMLAISKWHYFSQACKCNFIGCRKTLLC